MALNINTITDMQGVTYENTYGVVELSGNNANLAVWTNAEQTQGLNTTVLGGVYEVDPAQADADTVAALAAVGITATIIE